MRAARRRGGAGGVAIEHVLADVEIEGRQLVGAESEQGGGDAVEIEAGIALAHLRIELRQLGQHEALQLRHLVDADALLLVEARQIGEHEADGVAQPAIGFDIGLDDVLADAQIFGEIRRRRPQAQDFRAVLFRDHLRRQGIAQRLGHFAALVVEHEAVGQHALVRRAAARADGLPAATTGTSRDAGPSLPDRDRPDRRLRPMRVDGIFHREDMGRAGIEPDIQNVLHLLVIVGLAAVAQERVRAGR